MKLALLGLLSLFGSATALKIHIPSHKQGVIDTPPADIEVKHHFYPRDQRHRRRGRAEPPGPERRGRRPVGYGHRDNDRGAAWCARAAGRGGATPVPGGRLPRWVCPEGLRDPGRDRHPG